MDKKILIIIDVQNDFINGALKNSEANQVCDNIVKKIENWDGEKIIFTQ
ncbi:isochorismatase family protein, partial [Klebsiella pneumoniae]|nr:isochorismatase family protein [Klebsiella pneumoniae]